MVLNNCYICVPSLPGKTHLKNKLRPPCCHCLEASQYPVQVYTDKNLEYLCKAKALNQQQLQWALFFLLFGFTISCHPGTKNSKANALSRKGEYYIGLKDSKPKD